MYSLIYVNVASKSHIWVVACSLPDGLPISYGTFPDCLCSHFETLWGTQSQGQPNPSAIVDMLWCCTYRKVIAKSQPEVEINCILLHLSAAASYIGAFGPFGLGYFFRLDGLSWAAWFCTVMVKDSHSPTKSDGTVAHLLWRLSGPADVGALGNWETGGVHEPRYLISQRGGRDWAVCVPCGCVHALCVSRCC